MQIYTIFFQLCTNEKAKGRRRQVGWFPATYVKLLQGGRNSGRNTPLSASKIDLHETILGDEFKKVFLTNILKFF